MKTHFLKPFDDGKYLSEEEALKLLETIPIPKDDIEKVEDKKPKQPEASSRLEIIAGNYLTAIQVAIPETIQTSAELQKARVELNARKEISLNCLAFYTANVPLYNIEKGKPFLLFGGREAFLRLYVPNIEEVCRQISGPDKAYTLPSADKAWALDEGISSGILKRFDLAELIETKYDDETGYFAIDPNKADELRGTKRKLAELIHGQGKDYFGCMQMLAEKGISETKVWLLNPDPVNSLAGSSLIGRASWLNGFGNDSYFNADGHGINYDIRVRGVRHWSATDTTSQNGGSP